MDYNSISIWIPLQDATVENGCMWFIPGSHTQEVVPHHTINHDPRVHGLEMDQVPPRERAVMVQFYVMDLPVSDIAARLVISRRTADHHVSAILTKEPPDLSQTNREIHPGLERIVRHSMEKNREERFDSARDLAFDLEAPRRRHVRETRWRGLTGALRRWMKAQQVLRE